MPTPYVAAVWNKGPRSRLTVKNGRFGCCSAVFRFLLALQLKNRKKHGRFWEGSFEKGPYQHVFFKHCIFVIRFSSNFVVGTCFACSALLGCEATKVEEGAKTPRFIGQVQEWMLNCILDSLDLCIDGWSFGTCCSGGYYDEYPPNDASYSQAVASLNKQNRLEKLSRGLKTRERKEGPEDWKRKIKEYSHEDWVADHGWPVRTDLRQSRQQARILFCSAISAMI